MRTSNGWFAVFERACVLALAGSALGIAVAVVRPGGLHLSAHARTSSCEAPAAEPLHRTAVEAAALCADRDVIIADARPASDFAAGHIANAIHLPCDASGEVAAQALAKIAGRTQVLVYGAGTDDAVAVARSIAQRSSLKVFALEGGFSAWEHAGLACASGPCDTCTAPGQSKAP